MIGRSFQGVRYYESIGYGTLHCYDLFHLRTVGRTIPNSSTRSIHPTPPPYFDRCFETGTTTSERSRREEEGEAEMVCYEYRLPPASLYYKPECVLHILPNGKLLFAHIVSYVNC
jgi:hypothetical protein